MKNYFNIKNKKIIINGGSKGIGLCLYKELGRNCDQIFSISRSNIESKNKFKADSSDFEQISSVFKKIYNRTGKIDCIVNVSAVTNNYNNLKKKDLYNFDKIIQNNVNSYYNTIILADKYMKRNGSIVNITSIAAHVGLSNNYAYSASKGGIKQMSKSMSIDYYEKKKIRINNIAPGYIKTSMTRNSFLNSKRSSIIKEKSIMKRWGSPNDLIGPVIFLCSDASKFITGIDLVVDGGFLTKGI